jgi:hypothetical protein
MAAGAFVAIGAANISGDAAACAMLLALVAEGLATGMKGTSNEAAGGMLFVGKGITLDLPSVSRATITVPVLPGGVVSGDGRIWAIPPDMELVTTVTD